MELSPHLKLVNTIPLKGKVPVEAGWQRFCTEPRKDPIRLNGHNMGIPTGPCNGLLVLDIDDREKFTEACTRNHWAIPETLTVKTGSGGSHHYYKYPSDGREYGNRACKPQGFDIRGLGGQVVAPGSVHPNGNKYEIIRDTPVVDAPEWLLGLYETRKPEPRPSPAGGVWSGSIDDLPLKSETRELIRHGAPKGQRSEAVMTVLNALVWANLSDAEIIRIFLEYPIGEKAREARDPEKWLQPQIGKARAMVTDRARPAGERQRTREARPGQVWDSEPDEPGSRFAIDPHFIFDCLFSGEAGDGRLFHHVNQNRYIFDHAAGDWYEWTGHHWALDAQGAALSAGVDAVIDAYAAEAKKAGIAATESNRAGQEAAHKAEKEKFEALNKRISALQQLQRRRNVLTMAAAGNGLKGDEWDCDPYLLAVQNGVIDLRTGHFRPGKPADYIRTAAPVEWAGLDAAAPEWEQFVADICGQDLAQMGYLFRLLGYGLLGVTLLHILPVLWGKGRNGKSTLLETLQGVLGPMAVKAESELLLEQRIPRAAGSPNSGVLSLWGARLAWVTETDEGRRLNASRVKELVGGDSLSARAPYGRRQVSFRPSHLLFLITNNKPSVPGSDYALWERIHLIPFEVSFVENPQRDNERPVDLGLPEKLRREGAGVLAWLVRGCLEFQRVGLKPPERVLAATREYQAAEDIVGQFIDERCHLAPDARSKSGELYAAYRAWAEGNGSRPMSGKRLNDNLRERGFDSYTARHTYFVGLGLVE